MNTHNIQQDNTQQAINQSRNQSTQGEAPSNLASHHTTTSHTQPSQQPGAQAHPRAAPIFNLPLNDLETVSANAIYGKFQGITRYQSKERQVFESAKDHKTAGQLTKNRKVFLHQQLLKNRLNVDICGSNESEKSSSNQKEDPVITKNSVPLQPGGRQISDRELLMHQESLSSTHWPLQTQHFEKGPMLNQDMAQDEVKRRNSQFAQIMSLHQALNPPPLSSITNTSQHLRSFNLRDTDKNHSSVTSKQIVTQIVNLKRQQGAIPQGTAAGHLNKVTESQLGLSTQGFTPAAKIQHIQSFFRNRPRSRRFNRDVWNRVKERKQYNQSVQSAGSHDAKQSLNLQTRGLLALNKKEQQHFEKVESVKSTLEKNTEKQRQLLETQNIIIKAMQDDNQIQIITKLPDTDLNLGRATDKDLDTSSVPALPSSHPQSKAATTFSISQNQINLNKVYVQRDEHLMAAEHSIKQRLMNASEGNLAGTVSEGADEEEGREGKGDDKGSEQNLKKSSVNDSTELDQPSHQIFEPKGPSPRTNSERPANWESQNINSHVKQVDIRETNKQFILIDQLKSPPGTQSKPPLNLKARKGSALYGTEAQYLGREFDTSSLSVHERLSVSKTKCQGKCPYLQEQMLSKKSIEKRLQNIAETAYRQVAKKGKQAQNKSSEDKKEEEQGQSHGRETIVSKMRPNTFSQTYLKSYLDSNISRSGGNEDTVRQNAVLNSQPQDSLDSVPFNMNTQVSVFEPSKILTDFSQNLEKMEIEKMFLADGANEGKASAQAISKWLDVIQSSQNAADQALHQQIIKLIELSSTRDVSILKDSHHRQFPLNLHKRAATSCQAYCQQTAPLFKTVQSARRPKMLKQKERAAEADHKAAANTLVPEYFSGLSITSQHSVMSSQQATAPGGASADLPDQMKQGSIVSSTFLATGAPPPQINPHLQRAVSIAENHGHPGNLSNMHDLRTINATKNVSSDNRSQGEMNSKHQRQEENRDVPIDLHAIHQQTHVTKAKSRQDTKRPNNSLFKQQINRLTLEMEKNGRSKFTNFRKSCQISMQVPGGGDDVHHKSGKQEKRNGLCNRQSSLASHPEIDSRGITSVQVPRGGGARVGISSADPETLNTVHSVPQTETFHPEPRAKSQILQSHIYNKTMISNLNNITSEFLMQQAFDEMVQNQNDRNLQSEQPVKNGNDAASNQPGGASQPHYLSTAVSPLGHEMTLLDQLTLETSQVPHSHKWFPNQSGGSKAPMKVGGPKDDPSKSFVQMLRNHKQLNKTQKEFQNFKDRQSRNQLNYRSQRSSKYYSQHRSQAASTTLDLFSQTHHNPQLFSKTKSTSLSPSSQIAALKSQQQHIGAEIFSGAHQQQPSLTSNMTTGPVDLLQTIPAPCFEPLVVDSTTKCQYTRCKVGLPSKNNLYQPTVQKMTNRAKVRLFLRQDKQNEQSMKDRYHRHIYNSIQNAEKQKQALQLADFVPDSTFQDDKQQKLPDFGIKQISLEDKEKQIPVAEYLQDFYPGKNFFIQDSDITQTDDIDRTIQRRIATILQQIQQSELKNGQKNETSSLGSNSLLEDLLQQSCAQAKKKQEASKKEALDREIYKKLLFYQKYLKQTGLGSDRFRTQPAADTFRTLIENFTDRDDWFKDVLDVRKNRVLESKSEQEEERIQSTTKKHQETSHQGLHDAQGQMRNGVFYTKQELQQKRDEKRDQYFNMLSQAQGINRGLQRDLTKHGPRQRLAKFMSVDMTHKQMTLKEMEGMIKN